MKSITKGYILPNIPVIFSENMFLVTYARIVVTIPKIKRKFVLKGNTNALSNNN